MGLRAAPYLLKGMETGSRPQKKRIARLLLQLGPPAFPWVKKALRHKDWRIRELSLTIVSRLAVPLSEKLPLLEHAFHDKNPYTRYTAVIELSRFGNKASSLLPAMRKLLEEGTHPLPGQSKWGQNGLHNHTKKDNKDAQPHMLSASDQAGGIAHIARIIKGRLCGTPDDVDREARLAIVRSLSHIQTDHKKASDLLLISLDDRNRLVRKETQRLLLHMGPSIAPVLIEYLQRIRSPKRRIVATILGQMGAKTLPGLLPLLKTQTLPSIWFHAAHAIQTMGAKIHPKLPQLCILWPTRPKLQQRKIAEIIGNTGRSGLPCIFNNLKHPAPTVRASAAYAAGRWASHNIQQRKSQPKTQSTKHRAQNTEHKTQSTKHRAQNTVPKTQSTKHSPAYSPHHLVVRFDKTSLA